MIKWEPEKLSEDLGEEVAKKFNLERRNLPNVKNVARIQNGLADIDYFGVNFEIRFRDKGDKLLVIDVFPYEKNLEGLLEYIKDQVENGVIFSETGILKRIGNRTEFRKYPERLEYIGVKEEEKEVSPGRRLKAVSISYKVTDRLLRLPHDSFRETTLDYAIRPILSWAYGRRNMNNR